MNIHELLLKRYRKVLPFYNGNVLFTVYDLDHKKYKFDNTSESTAQIWSQQWIKNFSLQQKLAPTSYRCVFLR